MWWRPDLEPGSWRTTVQHSSHGSILTLTFLVVAGAISPQKASPQVVESTSPRLGGAFMRAFGGDGWGGTVGLTHGLFSGAIPLGGLGVDLTWARPRIVGDPTAGVPTRRDLASIDVHLRTRILRRPLALELGLPVGLAWSRVGEAAVAQADAEAPPESLSGTEWGVTAGVLRAYGPLSGHARPSSWSRRWCARGCMERGIGSRYTVLESRPAYGELSQKTNASLRRGRPPHERLAGRTGGAPGG